MEGLGRGEVLLYLSWNFAKQHYFEDKRFISTSAPNVNLKNWKSLRLGRKSRFGSITSYVGAEGGV